MSTKTFMASEVMALMADEQASLALCNIHDEDLFAGVACACLNWLESRMADEGEQAPVPATGVDLATGVNLGDLVKLGGPVDGR